MKNLQTLKDFVETSLNKIEVPKFEYTCHASSMTTIRRLYGL